MEKGTFDSLEKPFVFSHELIELINIERSNDPCHTIGLEAWLESLDLMEFTTIFQRIGYVTILNLTEEDIRSIGFCNKQVETFLEATKILKEDEELMEAATVRLLTKGSLKTGLNMLEKIMPNNKTMLLGYCSECFTSAMNIAFHHMSVEDDDEERLRSKKIFFKLSLRVENNESIYKGDRLLVTGHRRCLWEEETIRVPNTLAAQVFLECMDLEYSLLE